MKRRTSIIAAFSFSLLLVSCVFQNTGRENANMSPERLSRIDTLLNGYINEGKLAGTTALISRNNHVIYHKSFGYSNIQDNIPMENGAIYGIASMTKLVTSVAGLILYERGYFQLNDKLSDYIPEFKYMKVFHDNSKRDSVKEAENPILIRDLFRHTSGIGFNVKDYREAGVNFKQAGTLKEFVQSISRVPLYHEPGSTFKYSYSTDILGHLIEELSGQSLRDFFFENIFEPLEMQDTDFYVPEEKKDRLAGYYKYREDSLILLQTYESSRFKKLPNKYSGGGGLVSTTEDYAKLLQMLLNYGKMNNFQILSRKTIELMKSDQLQNVSNKGFLSDGRGHGLGGALVTNADQYGELISTGSLYWAGIRNTYFWIDYEENLYGILMMQMSPFSYLPFEDKFRILTYQAITD